MSSNYCLRNCYQENNTFHSSLGIKCFSEWPSRKVFLKCTSDQNLLGRVCIMQSLSCLRLISFLLQKPKGLRDGIDITQLWSTFFACRYFRFIPQYLQQKVLRGPGWTRSFSTWRCSAFRLDNADLNGVMCVLQGTLERGGGGGQPCPFELHAYIHIG